MSEVNREPVEMEDQVSSDREEVETEDSSIESGREDAEGEHEPEANEHEPEANEQELEAELSPEELAARELQAAKAAVTDNYDRFLRAKAELDNYRKRTAKIRTEVREETMRDMLLGLSPIFDNLRRALAQETTDAVVLKEGIELISLQIEDSLKGYGLEVIEAVGKPFDPNVHEAIVELESKDHDPGTVVEELDRGYLFGDRVIRPARVVVSKAGEANG